MKKEDVKAEAKEETVAKSPIATNKKKAVAKKKSQFKKKPVAEKPSQENIDNEPEVIEPNPQPLLEQPPVAEAVIINLAGEFRELVGQLPASYPESERPVLYEQAYGVDGFITRLLLYRNNPGLTEAKKPDYDQVVGQVKKAVDERLAGYKPSAKDIAAAKKAKPSTAPVAPAQKNTTNTATPVLPPAPGSQPPAKFIPQTPQQRLDTTFDMIVAYIKKARSESILLHEYALRDMLKVESIGGLNFTFDSITKKITGTLGTLSREEVLTCF